jgi:hypothetical protein
MDQDIALGEFHQQIVVPKTAERNPSDNVDALTQPPDYSKLEAGPELDLEEEVRGKRSTNDACQELWHSPATYRYLVAVFLVVGGIIMAALQWPRHSDLILKISGGCIAGVTYIIYMIRIFFYSDNFKYLIHANMIFNIEEHMSLVKQSSPCVTWTMTCYHNERRTRRVSRTVNGRRHYHTETYYVKVATWVGSQTFLFNQWWDCSAPGLAGSNECQHTRIKFHKNYIFADANTAGAFDYQKEAFVQMNRCRDVLFDFNEQMDIPGFIPTALASTTNERPFFLSAAWYATAAVLLLELPFSFFMKKISSKKDFTYIKVLKF